jgi:hypothetical protein
VDLAELRRRLDAALARRPRLESSRSDLISAAVLLPVENGGNIRTYHILRYLAAHYDLTFYSYYGGAEDPAYERELRQRLPGSIAVCTGKRELSGVAAT